MAIKYSELQIFFSRESFTEEELEKFKNKIHQKLSPLEITYLDNLIQNQLLAYKKTNQSTANIIGPNEQPTINIKATHRPIINKKNNHSPVINKPTNPSSAIDTSTHQHSVTYIDKILNEFPKDPDAYLPKLVGISVENLAKHLNLNLPTFRIMLARVHLQLKGHDCLTLNQLEKLKNTIRDRVRIKQVKTPRRSGGYSRSRSNSDSNIYDIIKDYGGIGKIIYIRMRS